MNLLDFQLMQPDSFFSVELNFNESYIFIKYRLNKYVMIEVNQIKIKSSFPDGTTFMKQYDKILHLYLQLYEYI